MKYSFLIVLLIFLSSCKNDDENNQSQDINYTCCGDNPFAATNIDNLDQSQGQITFDGFTTPNQDGFNDTWFPNNLSLYENFSLEIFSLDNESVFSTNTAIPFPFNDQSIPEGIYRYKVIVENENIYKQEGYFCVIIDDSMDLSTAECDPLDFDPIIDNN